LGRDINATLIHPHPALGDFPHGGYCDLMFYHMISSLGPNRGAAFNLDRFSIPIEPIIRVFSVNANAAYLFEAHVDRGMLLATSLDFSHIGRFPEVSYFFGQLVHYATSARFRPRARLSIEDLMAASWGRLVDFESQPNLRIPGTEFAGGGLERFPNTRVLNRQCNWVYAACTPCNRMELRFRLRRPPARAVQLALEGGNFSDRKDRKNRVDVRMAVNGHVFFEGPNDFPDDDFGEGTFLIERDHFRKGRNTILISNLEPEGPLGDAPFFAVTYLQLQSSDGH
jgi:hypothetical protein